MIKTNLYPLRTIVGESIRIVKILDIAENNGEKSTILNPINSQRRDVVNNSAYAKFLPIIIKAIKEDNLSEKKVTFRPGAAMDSMPPHNSNRFLSQFQGDMQEHHVR